MKRVKMLMVLGSLTVFFLYPALGVQATLTLSQDTRIKHCFILRAIWQSGIKAR